MKLMICQYITPLLYVRIDSLLQYEANALSATALLYVRINSLLQYEANALSATTLLCED
jgi:hypothetical protein